MFQPPETFRRRTIHATVRSWKQFVCQRTTSLFARGVLVVQVLSGPRTHGNLSMVRGVLLTMAAGATRLDYALLALIGQAPRSGYDLRRIFALTPLAHFSDSPGAVYPSLRRLQRTRWVEPVSTRPEGGRRREAFRLTRTGRRAARGGRPHPVTPDAGGRGPA